MGEKRGVTRHYRRLSLRFGETAPDRLAFTKDLSDEGMFITTSFVTPPGMKISVLLSLPDGPTVKCMAVVMWAMKIPQSLMHLGRKGGMGVKIISFEEGEDAYREYLAGLKGGR